MQSKSSTSRKQRKDGPVAVLAAAAVLAAVVLGRPVAHALSEALRPAMVVLGATMTIRITIGLIRFVRASPAARRNYPAAWLARARWRWLIRASGLAHPHGSRKTSRSAEVTGRTRLVYPRARIRPDDYGLVAAVKTIPKSGRAEFEKVSQHFADEWRCVKVRVSQPRPGRLIVRGLRKDPLAVPFASDAVPAGALDDPARPYLGLSEWAEHRHLSLPGCTGIVIGGIPGRGKTGLVSSLLYQWAPSPAVALAFADGKGSDDLTGWADRAWLHCGDDLEDAVALLEECHKLMRRRLGCVLEVTGRKNSWHIGPTPRWPLLIVIVDECQQFLDVASYKGDREREALSRRCVELVAELVRKGRSAMAVCVLATQKPTGDSIPTSIRDNSGISLCFGVKTVAAAEAVLGPDIKEYGSVSPVGLRDDAYVGVLTSSLATGQDPFTRVRVPGFTEEEITERAAATAGLRVDPAAQLPVPVLTAVAS